MSKKKEVQPRMIWTYQETEDLIEIMQSKFISKIIMNRNCRKWPIFEEVKQEMDRYGHDKTTQQIIFKYKNLCAMYRTGRQQGGKVSTKDKRFEFYEKMHELFQDLPNASEIDETEHDENVLSGGIEGDDDNDGNEDRKEGLRLLTGSTTSKKQFIKSSNDEDDDPLRDFEWTVGRNSPPSKKRRYETNEPSNDEINQEQSEIDGIDKKGGTSTKISNYMRCVNYLIKGFKEAQEDLQSKFYAQQLKLQQQQQEWEERMLDEEREFFTKVLKSRTKNDYSY